MAERRVMRFRKKLTNYFIKCSRSLCYHDSKFIYSALCYQENMLILLYILDFQAAIESLEHLGFPSDEELDKISVYVRRIPRKFLIALLPLCIQYLFVLFFCLQIKSSSLWKF